MPLNLLGVGVASQEALNYIREDVRDVAKLRQIVVNANVGGDLFDLWAGPVAFNVGGEYREEKASFTPSSFVQNGEGRGAPVTPISGSYNVKEAFGEILVPLISPENNFPVLYSAEVFGRVRYVDNSVNGGFTSYAVGGTIQPIRDIKLRGNFTRSFRAPAITEPQVAPEGGGGTLHRQPVLIGQRSGFVVQRPEGGLVTGHPIAGIRHAMAAIDARSGV